MKYTYMAKYRAKCINKKGYLPCKSSFSSSLQQLIWIPHTKMLTFVSPVGGRRAGGRVDVYWSSVFKHYCNTPV